MPTSFSVFPRSRAPRAAQLVLALVLVFARALPASAAPPPTPAAVPAAVVVGGWGLNRVFSLLEVALGERRRMIQLGVLGMCVGLFILMRK